MSSVDSPQMDDVLRNSQTFNFSNLTESIDVNYQKNGRGNYIVALVQWFSIAVAVVYSSIAFATDDYRLGGGDTVTISVYEQPDLSTVTRISQDDGTITYPLLGEVTIVGLTAEEAGQKIAKLLKSGGFLKFPEVNLTVNEYVSQKIPIMGQVNKPGEYAIKGQSRILDLIAQAGGVKTDAADVIVVVKNQEGKSVRHQIDLLAFYDGDMSQNIEVAEGDLILVPKMDTFYIHGEVNRPGSYRLDREMTVMQALSLAGGISTRGSLRRIKVTRRTANGNTEKIDMELTDQLKPNDVLHVKERLF